MSCRLIICFAQLCYGNDLPSRPNAVRFAYAVRRRVISTECMAVLCVITRIDCIHIAKRGDNEDKGKAHLYKGIV